MSEPAKERKPMSKKKKIILIVVFACTVFLVLAMIGYLSFVEAKGNLLEAWTGEFSNQKHIAAIKQYHRQCRPYVASAGEKPGVSFDVDFEVAYCHVWVSQVDDTDIKHEFNRHLLRQFYVQWDENIVLIPTGWWYRERDSWVGNHPLWAYLVMVRDMNGNDHWYYFRINYQD